MPKITPTHLLAFLMTLLLLAVVYLFIDRMQEKQENTTQSSNAVQTDSASQPLRVLPVEQRLKGADISHWDGEIDWAALKRSGISFLFIKATQGTTYVDPRFDYNYQTASNYGFYKGAYHFYQPHMDPKEQALHFLSVAKPQNGDLLPVLDIEISKGVDAQRLSQDVKRWVEVVKDSIGRYPIIYTDRYFWNASINSDLSQCPLWIADWESGESPILPMGWKQWVFWQYSSTGSLPGIPDSQGKVDLDYFYGNKASIRSFQIQ